MCGLVRSWSRVRKITGGRLGCSIFFFWWRRILSSRREDEIVEVDPVRDGNGLVLLPDGRDGRQLVLLLTLSVEPSLWAQEFVSERR